MRSVTPPSKSVWTRFQDNDPRGYDFGVTHLWLRRRRRGLAVVAEVYWDPGEGRLRAVPREPPWIQRLLENGHGWWAFVTQPKEPEEA